MTSLLNRSPLLVFLLLGACAVFLERRVAPGGERTVTVTAEQVDALRARWDAQWGRPPTGRELRGLVDEAVREEILYREALRMDLDRDDPIVRRRLARKMTFMLEDNAELPPPLHGEVADYFAAHVDRYRGPVRTTFQHVFLSSDRRMDPLRDAAALLPEVRGRGARGWRQAGDPFALLREYADRSDQELAELFGSRFASALGRVEPGDWQGPIDSIHGVHLVRVLGRSSPGTPRIDDVREQVVQDLLEARRREQNRSARQALRQRYAVRMPATEASGARP